MTENQTKQNRIVILSKAFGIRWEQKFFEDIQEAILDGYRIAKTNLREDASMRNFRGRIGKAVMYLEGHEPEAWKSTQTPEVDRAKENNPVVVPKEETSTGVIENNPVKEAKDSSESESKAKAARTAAKSAATKSANRAKKEALKAT